MESLLIASTPLFVTFHFILYGGWASLLSIKKRKDFFGLNLIFLLKKSRNKPEVKEEVKIEKKVKVKEPTENEGLILPI